jgi:type I restriction enzyme R subunit
VVRRGRSEEDTCREFVLPSLQDSGWRKEQIQEQVHVTDGRVIFTGGRPDRDKELIPDYLLEVSPDFPVAVVEAKREYRTASDGLQQAKGYAELLDLPVALATNGHEIVEFGFDTGVERSLDRFPRPDEAWARFQKWKGITDAVTADVLKEPFNRALVGVDGLPKEPRYYQRIAIHRAVTAILNGRKRLLLTMATGAGKTFTALQIVWKVWRYWETLGKSGTGRVLYLADRDVLISRPMRDFREVFGDSVHRILGEATTAYSIFFSTYQALRDDLGDPRFRRDFPPDFFDLIVVDECHRGSARDDSSWREILVYFDSAAQLGMTATPKRDANVDTYNYFGDPLYTYSLRQGISDGFLAPYRVHRVVLSPDAFGWRPDHGELDRYGRDIPDKLYKTSDFERVVSLLSRTDAAARYLTDYLRANGRMNKMAIFCVDSEHAADMRRAISNANTDMTRQQSDYVARIVADEEQTVKADLERFADEESPTPVVATTARLLTTGVDIPTLHTVVLFKPIRSIVEFKQIIGRGSRLAPDYDKLSFAIIDFTGATILFEDPDFDGPADVSDEDEIDEQGNVVDHPSAGENKPGFRRDGDDAGSGDHRDKGGGSTGKKAPRYSEKLYVDNTPVYKVAEGFWVTDPATDRLELVEYRDYATRAVRRLFPTPTGLRMRWREAPGRAEIVTELRSRGIDLDELAVSTDLQDMDALDLLIHLAWNEPKLTRFDRARRVRRNHGGFFGSFQPEAREVLELLLERYATYGIDDMTDARALEADSVREFGTLVEIAERFGGPERMRAAVEDLQRLLYAA